VHGLIAYASYVPRHQLTHAEVATVLGSRAGAGSRAIASYDEDSTTMGVEAARRALAGNGGTSSIYFATTSPAYFDKTNASAVHAALDLDEDGFALDLAGSTRGGIGALRTAATCGGLAVLSDVRTGRPGSADEREGGDAAAAFMFDVGGEPIAEVIAESASTVELLDRWRAPGEIASQVWEERFGGEAYLSLMTRAASRVLDQAGLERADHVVISSPHRRAVASAAKLLAGRIEHRLLPTGYAGAADIGIGLAAVLDTAGAGETILLINAADGCDAILLRTTDKLASRRATESVAGQLALGLETQYATYLSWRGLLEREPPRRPEPDRPAGPPSARSVAWKFALVGSECTACGRVHAPPTRVCSGCHEVDRMRPAPLASKLGTVATFTVDRLAHSPSPPMIDVVVDFDGGGRCTFELTDSSPTDVEIGTRVEMTFRRLYTSGGVHNYFWKARPAGDSAASTEEA
jgi:3-hydroxy-3-methylglutaryl CoA synthase/uncharacterized OB-fold protein